MLVFSILWQLKKTTSKPLSPIYVMDTYLLHGTMRHLGKAGGPWPVGYAKKGGHLIFSELGVQGM